MHCMLLQSFADVFPHLVMATDVPTLVKIADVEFSEVGFQPAKLSGVRYLK